MRREVILQRRQSHEAVAVQGYLSIRQDKGEDYDLVEGRSFLPQFWEPRVEGLNLPYSYSDSTAQKVARQGAFAPFLYHHPGR